MEEKMNIYPEAITSKIKTTAADEIYNSIERLVNKANDVAGEVSGRLDRVCMPNGPQCESEEEKRDYPQYFADISNMIDRINKSLDHIGNVMVRCEI